MLLDTCINIDGQDTSVCHDYGSDQVTICTPLLLGLMLNTKENIILRQSFDMLTMY